MGTLRKIVREGLTAELLSISGAILAAVGLAKMAGLLEEIPGLLVMTPGMLAIRGSIAGSLSARIGTGLHTGTIEPQLRLEGEVLSNVVAALTLGTLESALIGLLSHLLIIYSGFTSAGLDVLLFISVVGGTLASVVQAGFSVALAIWVFQRGVDPDSVMGPIVTTTGDFVCVISMYLTARIALNIFRG
ncbi:MAG: magnesium transporter [Candidatus Bathyarchaeia archaeon]